MSLSRKVYQITKPLETNPLLQTDKYITRSGVDDGVCVCRGGEAYGGWKGHFVDPGGDAERHRISYSIYIYNYIYLATLPPPLLKCGVLLGGGGLGLTRI